MSADRDPGYMSQGHHLGYASQGGQSGVESARLSNVNTFKYNGPSSATKNLAPLIRKVSPGLGVTMDYSS